MKINENKLKQTELFNLLCIHIYTQDIACIWSAEAQITNPRPSFYLLIYLFICFFNLFLRRKKTQTWKFQLAFYHNS